MSDREDRLFARAWEIFDRQAHGFGEPILQHLAMRGYVHAMLEIARRWTPDDTLGQHGAVWDRSAPANLMYRAWRAGDADAAQNIAMGCFNRGDLAGYRLWLGRAARAGAVDAADELRRFETRLPHRAARLIGRGRPYRIRDRS